MLYMAQMHKATKQQTHQYKFWFTDWCTNI